MPRPICFFYFLFFSAHSISQIADVKVFRTQGQGCEFSPDMKKIAYDMKGKEPEKYYEIHIADLDGKNDTCLTCGNASLPQRHTGSPSWHVSGKYIMFVAEKKIHPRKSVDAIPGFGAFSDIWVITADGKKAFQLTDIPNDYDHGVIGPKFSADGKKVVWVERKLRPRPAKAKHFFGLWVIKTADFIIENDIPRLDNIKTYEPGGDAFYETYGFSPDGKRIIFCSNFNVKRWWSSRIFTIDASTGGNLTQLTTEDYNEHATYSHDGKKIVWMTNTLATGGATDWWMMNADGSHKQRLTYFNEPWYPHYMGKRVWAGLTHFAAGDESFIGGVQTSLRLQEGIVYSVNFLPAGSGNGLIGEYFTHKNFEGTSSFRYDSNIAFWWGPQRNDSLVKSKEYSVRWTGFIEPLYSEEYTFYTSADKNFKLWIDGKEIIDDKMKPVKGERTGKIILEKGKRHVIKIEYQNTLNANGKIFFAWSSASQYKQYVPGSQLYAN